MYNIDFSAAIWFLILAASCIFFLCYLHNRVALQKAAFFALESDDDDVKIAPGSFSGSKKQQDLADQAAQEFLRQKKLGNVDKARQLGTDFAELLWVLAQELIMGDGNVEQREVHHRLLLCSYAVCRVVSEASPNSIVAQTSLSRFYSAVEERSNVLSRHVSDTAAFSLYILSERSKDDIAEIGKIFAKLIGQEGDIEKAGLGNQVFSSFYEKSLQLSHSVEWSE